MSLPTDTPITFQLRKVEEKKRLPADGDKPEKVILKLGLEHDGNKAWAEDFYPTDESKWPKEGGSITLTLDPPKQEGWAYQVRKPPRGGGGKGGGFNKKSPAELAEERASIEAQSALKGAIEYAAHVRGGVEVGVLDIKSYANTFAEAIKEAKEILRGGAK